MTNHATFVACGVLGPAVHSCVSPVVAKLTLYITGSRISISSRILGGDGFSG